VPAAAGTRVFAGRCPATVQLWAGLAGSFDTVANQLLASLCGITVLYSLSSETVWSLVTLVNVA